MRTHEETTIRAIEGQPEQAFATVEGSRNYVAQLLQALEEAVTDVSEELARIPARGGRRREAFQVVAYKLEKLDSHLRASQRLLNDLVALRHIVDGEPFSLAA
jgi:hypothetical protein